MIPGEMARLPDRASRSLADVYERHADGALRLAFLLTGDRRLAEDVVQDAFVRLARRFMHLRDLDSLDPYLRRIVINLCNSHFRRRRLERMQAERQATMRERADDGVDVASRVTMKEAVLMLPTRQRTAVVLRFYEDLSERQSAELMGCGPGTVKALVHQAMTTLRRTMVVAGD